MLTRESMGLSTRYLIILCGALVWSCGGEPESEPEDEVGSIASELVGGTTVVPAGMPVNVAGALMVGNRLICAATLLENQRGWTAQECATDPALYEGTKWEFVTGKDLSRPDSRTPVNIILSGPGYPGLPARLEFSTGVTPLVADDRGVLVPVNASGVKKRFWYGFASGGSRNFIVSYGSVAPFDDAQMARRYSTISLPKLGSSWTYERWISELYRTSGLSRRIIEITRDGTFSPFEIKAKTGESICPRDLGGAVMELDRRGVWSVVGYVADLKDGLGTCTTHARLSRVPRLPLY